MVSLNDTTIPLLALYAEIHYRFFPFFPSLLYKREPEIIFDVAPRIDPGNDIPIVLIINDINSFPITPLEVSVSVTQVGTGTQLFPFKNLPNHIVHHPLESNQTAYLFWLSAATIPDGELLINATLTFEQMGKKKVVFNDNLNGASHRAFICYKSITSLPGSALCTYGDLHVHSNYSQSHVEFGAPLKVIDKMAHTSGLSFVGIADHSYDLACSLDSYLKEEEQVTRWHLLKKELANQSDYTTMLLGGEEISCANTRGETVHLVGFGHSEFIPGSRDGARQKKVFTSQLTINEVVAKIQAEQGIAFAAHPASKSGFLQKLLLYRGNWSEADFIAPLDGIQPLNSGFKKSWDRGKALWINLLQKGKQLPLLAGNDAHGDFSRYRAIKKPFLSIHEDFQRFMGYARTGVYGQSTTQQQLFEAIRRGATFVTTGPYLAIVTAPGSENQAPARALYGCVEHNGPRMLHAQSTPEFGPIEQLTVYKGSYLTPCSGETIHYSSRPQSHSFELLLPLPAEPLPHGTYLRAEAVTKTAAQRSFMAFTSAVFF